MDGNGNSLIPIEYAFDDPDILANGIYAYRLKQVDYDGTYEYSDIVTVRIDRELITKASVYPNPASRFINLEVEVSERSEIRVMLLDISGKLMKADMVEMDFVEGREKIRINIDDVPGGSYIMRIQLGSKIINERVLFIGK